MKKTTIVGSVLIIYAVFTWLGDASDTIKELKDWHGLATPAIVAIMLKKLSTIVLATIGGTLMPQPHKDRNKERISDKRLEQLQNND